MSVKKLLTTYSALGVLLLAWTSASAEVNSVFISSTLDPNAIIITEVDIIFIYDEEIAATLPATKSDWYSSKRQFTQAASERMDIVNVFIPQGFDSEMASLPERRGEALKVVVYAYHDDSKAPPRDISDMSDALIQIDPFGIRLSERP